MAEKQTILVVEDNVDWSDLWTEVVNRMGFEVVLVNTVADAIDKLQNDILLGMIADGMNEAYDSLVNEAISNGIIGENIFVVSANLLRYGIRKRDNVSFLRKEPETLNKLVFKQPAQV